MTDDERAILALRKIRRIFEGYLVPVVADTTGETALQVIQKMNQCAKEGLGEEPADNILG